MYKMTDVAGNEHTKQNHHHAEGAQSCLGVRCPLYTALSEKECYEIEDASPTSDSQAVARLAMTNTLLRGIA